MTQLTINEATDFLLTCLKHCTDDMQNQYRKLCLSHLEQLYGKEYADAIRKNLVTKLKIAPKKRSKPESYIELP
jgi:hypothetical protein